MQLPVDESITTIISIIEDRCGYRTDENMVHLIMEDEAPVRDFLNALSGPHLLKSFYRQNGSLKDFNYNALSNLEKKLYVYFEDHYKYRALQAGKPISPASLYLTNFPPSQFRYAVLIEPDLQKKLTRVATLAEQGYMPAKDWLGRYYLTLIQNNLDNPNSAFVADNNVIQWLVTLLQEAYTAGYSKTIRAVENFICFFLQESIHLSDAASTPDKKEKCRYMGKIALLLATRLSSKLVPNAKAHQVPELIEACLQHSSPVPSEQIKQIKNKRKEFSLKLFNTDIFHRRHYKSLQLNQFCTLMLAMDPTIRDRLKKNNINKTATISLPPKPSILKKIKYACLDFLGGEFFLVCIGVTSITVFVGIFLASANIFSPALLLLSASGIALGTKAVTAINIMLYAVAGTLLGAAITTACYIKNRITEYCRSLRSPSITFSRHKPPTLTLKKEFFELTVSPTTASQNDEKNAYHSVLGKKYKHEPMYVPTKHDTIHPMQNSHLRKRF